MVGGSIYLGSQPWLNGEWHGYGTGATGTVTTPEEAISGAKSAMQGPMYSQRAFENRATIETINWKMKRAGGGSAAGILGYYSCGDYVGWFLVASDGHAEMLSSAKSYPIMWGLQSSLVLDVTFEIDYAQTFGTTTNDAAGGWGVANYWGDGGVMYYPLIVTVRDAGDGTVLWTNFDTLEQNHMFGVAYHTALEYETNATIGFIGEGMIFDDILARPTVADPCVCGDYGTVYAALDFTGPDGVPDCYVNLAEFGVLAGDWMKNTDPAAGSGINVASDLSSSKMSDPIVIDGNIDDWQGGNWNELDQAYHGFAEDIEYARYTTQWDSNTDRLLAAVVVKDTEMIFEDFPSDWNTSDRLELYSQGDGQGGEDYADSGYLVAQQYIVGSKQTTPGVAWALLADYSEIPAVEIDRFDDFEGPEYVDGMNLLGANANGWSAGSSYMRVTGANAIADTKSAMVIGTNYVQKSFSGEGPGNVFSWLMQGSPAALGRGAFAYQDTSQFMVTVDIFTDGVVGIGSAARGHPHVLDGDYKLAPGTIVEVICEIDYTQTFGTTPSDAEHDWGIDNCWDDGGTLYHPVVVTLKDYTTGEELYTNRVPPSHWHYFGVLNRTVDEVARYSVFAALGGGAIIDNITMEEYDGETEDRATGFEYAVAVDDVEDTITYEVAIPQYSYDPCVPGAALCTFDEPIYADSNNVYDGGQWSMPTEPAYQGTASIIMSGGIDAPKSMRQESGWSAFPFAENDVPEHDRLSMKFKRAAGQGVNIFYYYGHCTSYTVAISVDSGGTVTILSSAKGYPVAWGTLADTTYEIEYVIDRSREFGVTTNDAAGGWGAANNYEDGGDMYHPVMVTLRDSTGLVKYTNTRHPLNQNHHFGVWNRAPGEMIADGGVSVTGVNAKFDTLVIPDKIGQGQTRMRLVSGQTVDFDLIAGTRHHDFEQNLTYAMLSENMLLQKYRDAGNFAEYALLAGVCGEWGYLASDLSGPESIRDCYVDFYDLACLLGGWLDCTDPANPACD